MKFLIVDGHCDSILDVAKGIRSLNELSDIGHLDFPRLKGNVNLQFMALYIEDEFKPHNSILRGLELYDIIMDEIKKTPYIIPVFAKNDLKSFNSDTVKVLLAIEGGEALGGSISVLRCFFKLGIRSLTLTWNQRNEIGDGCGEKNPLGISNFGKKVIQEMNKLGMLIDISHLSEKGFWDVLNISSKPIVASHSCCKNIASHPRNLTDKQLKALAENGGLIGINYYPKFLSNEHKKASIDDVVKHILHAAEIMGCEHIGLGSDFDGIEDTPHGLENATKHALLIPALEKVGFTNTEINNIMGNNFIRLLKKVLPNA